MVDRAKSGTLLGIPYNFERPSIGRLFSAYWQPGDGMLVEKPFGIGYTLNLASWRSWIVLAIVGVLVLNERKGRQRSESDEESPVEVVVED